MDDLEYYRDECSRVSKELTLLYIRFKRDLRYLESLVDFMYNERYVDSNVKNDLYELFKRFEMYLGSYIGGSEFVRLLERCNELIEKIREGVEVEEK